MLFETELRNLTHVRHLAAQLVLRALLSPIFIPQILAAIHTVQEALNILFIGPYKNIRCDVLSLSLLQKLNSISTYACMRCMSRRGRFYLSGSCS